MKTQRPEHIFPSFYDPPLTPYLPHLSLPFPTPANPLTWPCLFPATSPPTHPRSFHLCTYSYLLPSLNHPSSFKSSLPSLCVHFVWNLRSLHSFLALPSTLFTWALELVPNTILSPFSQCVQICNWGAHVSKTIFKSCPHRPLACSSLPGGWNSQPYWASSSCAARTGRHSCCIILFCQWECSSLLISRREGRAL